MKFGKLLLDFSDLAEESKKKNSHKYISANQRANIDQVLVKNPKMRIACKLLYDLAARSQDLTDLKFSSFVKVPNGGANVTWVPRK